MGDVSPFTFEVLNHYKISFIMLSVINNQLYNTTSKNKKSLKDKYLDFCDSQMPYQTLWYLIPLMSLSAAIMPISIFLMSYFKGYLLFIAVSVLLFYTNIILSIVQKHTRTLITMYLFTVLFHIICPLTSFLIKFL